MNYFEETIQKKYIETEVSKLVEKIYKKTGIRIQTLEINYVDVTEIGDSKPKFVIGSIYFDELLDLKPF